MSDQTTETQTQPKKPADLRKARGWSQGDLVLEVYDHTKMRVSQDTVKAVEYAWAIPSVTIAMAIAQTLGVPVEAIAWPTPEQVKDNPKSRRNRSPKKTGEIVE